MTWCLFSAAYVDFPAEEEGKRNNKRAEKKKGREFEGGKQNKNKADRENEQKRNVCDEQEKQELLATRSDGTQCLRHESHWRDAVTVGKETGSNCSHHSYRQQASSGFCVHTAPHVYSSCDNCLFSKHGNTYISREGNGDLLMNKGSLS